MQHVCSVTCNYTSVFRGNVKGSQFFGLFLTCSWWWEPHNKRFSGEGINVFRLHVRILINRLHRHKLLPVCTGNKITERLVKHVTNHMCFMLLQFHSQYFLVCESTRMECTCRQRHIAPCKIFGPASDWWRSRIRAYVRCTSCKMECVAQWLPLYTSFIFFSAY